MRKKSKNKINLPLLQLNFDLNCYLAKHILFSRLNSSKSLPVSNSSLQTPLYIVCTNTTNIILQKKTFPAITYGTVSKHISSQSIGIQKQLTFAKSKTIKYVPTTPCGKDVLITKTLRKCAPVCYDTAKVVSLNRIKVQHSALKVTHTFCLQQIVQGKLILQTHKAGCLDPEYVVVTDHAINH